MIFVLIAAISLCLIPEFEALACETYGKLLKMCKPQKWKFVDHSSVCLVCTMVLLEVRTQPNSLPRLCIATVPLPH
uniref:Secreted protein n=1 Tax=Romanomermis culicivorax TaxID=13658 RepID=A0A915IGS3_ROMCU